MLSFKEKLKLWGTEQQLTVCLDNRQTSHPNVVTLIGACVDPIPCLVLEYLPGGSLLEAIKEKKLQNCQKISFARDIAAGLNYLHIEKKIVHRDIKPHNILVE